MSSESSETIASSEEQHGIGKAAAEVLIVDLTGTCLCGASRWTFRGDVGVSGATACNCTLCRRYGALWVYGFEGSECSISGPVSSFKRVGKSDPALEVLFCPVCACVLSWRGLRQAEKENGRHRMAVNLRLAEPELISEIPVARFDGKDSFEDLPPIDGRCVKDLWF